MGLRTGIHRAAGVVKGWKILEKDGVRQLQRGCYGNGKHSLTGGTFFQTERDVN